MTDHKPVCQCGATYRDDSAGVFYHRRDHGHTPAPMRDWPVAKRDGSRTDGKTTGRTR